VQGNRGFWLQCLIGGLLIAAALGGGWLAYGRSHNATRRFSVSLAGPCMIPGDFESIGLPITPPIAGLSAGDRVDVMVVIDNQPEPLILDALVVQKTKTNFALLVRVGQRDLISYVRQNKLELTYRPSIVPAEAEYTADFREALIKFERLRAEGKVKL
jgi:hypothetical protein